MPTELIIIVTRIPDLEQEARSGFIRFKTSCANSSASRSVRIVLISIESVGILKALKRPLLVNDRDQGGSAFDDQK